MEFEEFEELLFQRGRIFEVEGWCVEEELVKLASSSAPT